MIDNGRKGRPIGGGLFFSGERESDELLKNSIKHISKRLPVKFKENEHEEVTFYVDFSFGEIDEKSNVFYIPTSFKEKQGEIGDISLNILDEDDIKCLRFEIENSQIKHFIDYRFKFKREKNLKAVLFIKKKVGKQQPFMMMWVDGELRTSKTLKNFKFAEIDPNIIIWNKFAQVYIKEACVWQNEESQEIIDEQRRLLTI